MAFGKKRQRINTPTGTTKVWSWLTKKTVMEKAAREVMVLKLNFGTNSSEKEKRLQRGAMMLETYLAQYCIQTVWLALRGKGTGTDCRNPDKGMQTTWMPPASVKHMHFHLELNRAKSQISESNLSSVSTCETSWQSSMRYCKIISEQEFCLNCNFCEVLLTTAGETMRKFITVFRPEFKCKGQQLKKEEERIVSDCCLCYRTIESDKIQNGLLRCCF